jgi:hypothetical protein
LDAYESTLRELFEGNLVIQEGDRLRLTYRGRMVGNEIFYRFLPSDDQQSA